MASSIKRWTEKEDDLLRAHWRTHGLSALRQMLLAESYDRTEVAISYRAKKLKLKRTPNEVRRLMFENNRGLFKKGNMPHNHREIGSIFRRTDGYLFIKTSEDPVNGTELYQRHLAKKHFGHDLTAHDMVIGIGRPIYKYKTAKALKRAFSQGKVKIVSRKELVALNANREKAAESRRQHTEAKKEGLHTYLTRLMLIVDELHGRYHKAKSKLETYLSYKDYAPNTKPLKREVEILRKRIHCLKMAYARARPVSKEFRDYPVAI